MSKRTDAKDKTQRFYDRIAEVHNLAFKLNGYRSSVAKYLKSLDLDLNERSYVLDAGCGSGIISLGFLDTEAPMRRAVAFDLSANLLDIAAEEFADEHPGRPVSPVQGNILQMPFADRTFDLVLTCGVLEYVPLDDGLREMARVLKPNGKLVLIPVKPSLVGSVLEIIYKFKMYPLPYVRKIARQYFTIVGNHEFSLTEPIGWSKTIFLLEKK